jgi:hypothetical protein
MDSYADRLTLAERHVREGRAVVERQREIVAKQIAAGRDATTSRLLLEQFERSLAIFEDDLAALLAEHTIVARRSGFQRRAAAARAPSASEDNG